MSVRLTRIFNRHGSTLLGLAAAIFVLSVLFDWFRPSNVPHTQRIAYDRVTQSQNVVDSNHYSKVGKVSMLYGTPGEVYERAIKSHDPHNERFGYKFFILREKMLPGYWSKPAYILSKLLGELSKPESERLEWLVWIDADVVIMNPNIPLEIFLPPPGWEHIHCVATNDHRGLNNGVIFMRVHEWSVWLMDAVLGTETYQPDLDLEFEDQTAMMFWLDQERFANNTIHVPQRWFNAYAGYRGNPDGLFADPLQPQWKARERDVKEGDLLVHHAGKKSLRAQRMGPWIDAAEQHLPQWELPLEETTYPDEIEKFWKNAAPQEERTQEALRATLAKNKAKQKAKADARKKEKEREKAAAQAAAAAAAAAETENGEGKENVNENGEVENEADETENEAENEKHASRSTV